MHCRCIGKEASSRLFFCRWVDRWSCYDAALCWLLHRQKATIFFSLALCWHTVRHLCMHRALQFEAAAVSRHTTYERLAQFNSNQIAMQFLLPTDVEFADLQTLQWIIIVWLNVDVGHRQLVGASGAPMPSTILIHQLRACNERFRAHCLLSKWDCWSVEQSELAARWEMRWRDKRVRWRANSLRRSVRRRTAI